MKITLLLLVVWTVASSAHAADSPEESGNAFVRVCSTVGKDTENRTELVNSMNCLSYIIGYRDGMQMAVAFAGFRTNKTVPVPYCEADPKKVENGQVINIVLKYIQEHPEDAHLRTSILITEALGKAFPCH